MRPVMMLLSGALLVSGLQLLPPVPGSTSDGAPLDLASISKAIYIDSSFASVTDLNGLTLIPPTAYEFAETFQQDLAQLTGFAWTLQNIDGIPSKGSGIFLGQFHGNSSDLTYEDGTPTEEGYAFTISSNRVFIGGTGARGMWWGTRTLLQQLLLSNGTLAPADIVDAPAYATRGFMLDAGRKYYAPSFLKELCTYASFFKLSEFHYHLSDNYPLNRGHNETWTEVYSHFSLLPEDESLHGIIERPNETLSRAVFADFQQHCAARGVTVIPEIEAPGHCLYLTKWKPEMALDKKDLLNLSHPEAIPTVKSIWSEFLPWFETKEFCQRDVRFHQHHFQQNDPHLGHLRALRKPHHLQRRHHPTLAIRPIRPYRASHFRLQPHQLRRLVGLHVPQERSHAHQPGPLPAVL
ncbi:Glycoside hydrolase family 20 [Macrophomina phaseolina MS6]|uniref:beta-N-acetylhexosaminidase n=1 Tax=Macrophomina phaseolina (strain MS6) TaxID=1126212 RepID=K2RB21_MACPH|nr:Glycoside hydrolase family 20 [Macrophomina phaseolina MS6]